MAIVKSTIDKLKKQYKDAKLAYNDGSSMMTDAEFDKLESKIKKLDPEWVELAKTGVRTKKQKQPLVKLMPSLNKVYPEAVIKSKLINSGRPLVISDKLDGSSVQLVYKNGKPSQLITRGDGQTGQDISYFIPYINIPKEINNKGTLVLRMEAVMPISVFEKKYKKKYDNPRNLVAGLLNRKLEAKDKELFTGLQDIDFVVLAQYEEHPWFLKRLTSGGFNVVSHIMFNVDSLISAKILTQLLTSRRTKSKYEMDGLVITDGKRKFDYTSTDKPKWAVAFKFNTEADTADTAIVKRVIWQTSHNGRLTPKIEIDGLQLDGVLIKHCTAHNAEWLTKQHIGKGAVVAIVRSGGVIPKIVKVIKKGETSLPDVSYEKKGVHFFVKKQGSEVKLKQIERFIIGQHVEEVRLSTIKLIVNRDPDLLSIPAFIQLVTGPQFNQYLTDLGVQIKTRNKLRLQFTKLKEINLFTAMVNSSCFDNLGDRKLALIDKHIPLNELLTISDVLTVDQLSTVKGLGEKTIGMLLDGIDRFLPLYKKLKKVSKVYYRPQVAAVQPTEGKLVGMLFSFTGYRDKQQEQMIVDNGGQIVTFGSKTTHLLVKPSGKPSSKVDTAKLRGTKVVHFDSLGL